MNTTEKADVSTIFIARPQDSSVAIFGLKTVEIVMYVIPATLLLALRGEFLAMASLRVSSRLEPKAEWRDLF